jgi:uncharacterized cupredoxin-like copper-binding protein
LGDSRPGHRTDHEYRFEPAHLVFRQGIAYRLHLDNEGKEMHEFTAPDFFKAVRVGNPEILAGNGDDVVVQPGQQRDLLFVAERPGRYRLTCADHDWAGMDGDITIE